jgi:hypothetical protein
LASFLAHRGKPYRLVRGEGRSAIWEFETSQVAELVAVFESGDGSVEPQSFHHSITGTRRMLFDFVNSGDQLWDEKKVSNHDPSRSARSGAR